MPGQDLLNPQYGLNLLQFVFQPATDTTAYLIGKTIMNNVSVYEPRVSVQNLDIKVNTDEQTFTITLSILVPSLNLQINLPGVLNKNGFSLLT
jgi:phage baseplate assembly protein W